MKIKLQIKMEKNKMPIGKNKTRINVYLENSDYALISKWCKHNNVSISSLYNMLTIQFIKNEHDGENTYILTSSKKKPLKKVKNTDQPYEDYINDHTRPDYNWLDAALYNLNHNPMSEI